MNTLNDLRGAFAELERRGERAVAAATERLVDGNDMTEAGADPIPVLSYRAAQARSRTRRLAPFLTAAAVAVVLAIGGLVAWLIGFRDPAAHHAAGPGSSSSGVTLDRCVLTDEGLVDAGGTVRNTSPHTVIDKFLLNVTLGGSGLMAATPRTVLVGAGQSVPWSISDANLFPDRAAARNGIRCELTPPTTAVVTSPGVFPIAQDALAERLQATASKAVGVTVTTAHTDGSVDLTVTSISGLLTVSGHTNWYALTIGQSSNDRASCVPPDCQASTLPDGSTLQVTASTPVATGIVSEQVRLYRTNGLSITLSLSNDDSSVSGTFSASGPKPALTGQQLVVIAQAMEL